MFNVELNILKLMKGKIKKFLWNKQNIN
jgi:hypothetical protein